MKFGSVCSGIEAASAAWEPLGWEPAWFAEIDALPSAVLAHRYPHVPNLGDFTRIGSEVECDGVALLVGGTPCQSFSVAGLRGGLADARGNLALEFCRLLLRLRPQWFVWENVPGVFSSWSGEPESAEECEWEENSDFAGIVSGFSECGYGVAWRVLDAQYVRVDGLERAVPQRRRRVFVVGYLGDWRPPAAVCLEPEGLCGNTPPSREAGQGFARDVANCLGADGVRCGGRVGDTRGQDNVVAVDSQNMALSGDIANTLQGEANRRGTRCGMNSANERDNGGGQVAIASEYIVRRLTPLECERLQGFPDHWTAIPYRRRRIDGPEADYLRFHGFEVECAANGKLYTRIAADGPRYKAIGNSMAVNCMRWLGRRIELVNGILEASA